MAKKRLLILWCLIFFASFCYGEVGDLDLTAGLNVVTDVNVGDNMKIGLLNTSSFPDVQLYISKGATPSGSVKELLRFERFGNTDAGQDGIGLSQTFYLENGDSSIVQVGGMEWSLPDSAAGAEVLFQWKFLTTAGLLPLISTSNNQIGFLADDFTSTVFFDFKDSGGDNADRILQIDMAGENHRIDWTGSG
ncbi:hypothetical protein LCGC14_2199300, partial [marine sediment metagenome]